MIEVRTSEDAPAPRFECRPATEGEDLAAKASLRQYNAANAGVAKVDKQPFAVMAYTGDRLAGGAIGSFYWGWLHIELLWTEEDFRGHGLGRAIMREAEAKAREMGLTGIYLWTQSWQAAGFYAKLGYEQFTEFKDFPPGHSRLGFRKYLV